jgi:hypothetical protein
MGAQSTNPDTTTYLLGRAKVFFSSINDSGEPNGFRFVGNVAEITATVDSETYEHYRSTQSLRQKDLDIAVQQSQNWTMTLENLNKGNLAIFFAATEDTSFVNPSITGFADTVLVIDGEMQSDADDDGGLWYQLVDADGNLATGITTTNNLTLESTNATPVTLTEDTDYEVNTTTGRVYFLDTAPIQTIITNGEGVTATVTADASAATVAKLGAGSSAETNAAVRIEVINANTSSTVDQIDMIMDIHKAGITANGDSNWISDEAAQLPISLAVEVNDAYDNPMDIFDLR